MGHSLRPEFREPDLDRWSVLIQPARCTGCRECEVACALSHGDKAVRPGSARIRVHGAGPLFLPVLAGPAVGPDHECVSKQIVAFGGIVVDQCLLCRASCPGKPLFSDPQTGLALKCDACLSLEEDVPLCVRACPAGALMCIDRSEAAARAVGRIIP